MKGQKSQPSEGEMLLKLFLLFYPYILPFYD